MTEETVFLLLRSCLFSEESIGNSDWGAAFNEMEKQAVAALPGEWLKSHPVSRTWSAYCSIQQGQWIRVMHAQTGLLSLLEGSNIPSVIIKGAAAAMYYPHPTLRSMGDVDILVKRRDCDTAAEILENNGYKLTHDKAHVSHHYNYSKDNICIELHKKIGVVRDSDERLLKLFETGIDNREWHAIGGYKFPVLPSELNGLVLIFHINQHIRAGLGLRQIIDWMMYVNKLSDNEWHDCLLPLLKETGMEQLALTVTAMCQKYLGLRQIVEFDDSLPYEELKDYIMAKGNFGRKTGDKDKTASYFFFVRDIRSFFKRLQAGGMSHWSAAQNHKALRPFAWIYQSFRILGIFFKNGVSPKEFTDQYNKGIEQRRLFEAMGLKLDIKIH